MARRKKALRFEVGEPVLITGPAPSSHWDYAYSRQFIGQVGEYFCNWGNGRHSIKVRPVGSRSFIRMTFTTSSLAKTKEFDIIDDPEFKNLYI